MGRAVLRGLLVVSFVVLAALPVVTELTGRRSLTLPFVAVALAGLCSLAAYRIAVALRRRIDRVADGALPARRPGGSRHD